MYSPTQTPRIASQAYCEQPLELLRPGTDCGGEAWTVCESCGKPICENHAVELRGQSGHSCRGCALVLFALGKVAA
jgi:hypothetical protein